MPTISDQDIQDQYQRVLGRSATSAELNQFKQFANSGDIPLTAQDIGDIIGGLPEAQKQSLDKYGADYANKLAGSDQQILDLAGKSLGQNFTQLVGAGNSTSAYVNAFANAARDLAISRQQQLGSFYGNGYQNIMGNQQGLSGSLMQRGVDSINSANTWARQRAMADMYHNYQQDLINRQSRQNKAGALIGLGGAAAGAAFGGYAAPVGQGLAGARLGGSLGGGLGQGFGSFF